MFPEIKTLSLPLSVTSNNKTGLQSYSFSNLSEIKKPWHFSVVPAVWALASSSPNLNFSIIWVAAFSRVVCPCHSPIISGHRTVRLSANSRLNSCYWIVHFLITSSETFLWSSSAHTHPVAWDTLAVQTWRSGLCPCFSWHPPLVGLLSEALWTPFGSGLLGLFQSDFLALPPTPPDLLGFILLPSPHGTFSWHCSLELHFLLLLDLVWMILCWHLPHGHAFHLPVLSDCSVMSSHLTSHSRLQPSNIFRFPHPARDSHPHAVSLQSSLFTVPSAHLSSSPLLCS